MTFFRLAPFALAACLASCASAQNPPPASCPPAQSMKAEQLFGLWAVRFSDPPAGLPARATLRLQRHAEFSDSLAGTVSRDLPNTANAPASGHAAQAALAGDLDEGLLLLDESSDKVSITGTWNGEMVAGSCGQAYQGVWKDTSAGAAPEAPGVPFTLTRLP
ncbi:MAG: hypothetical protein M3R45_07720 [Pseudomonadota bacterium]|nr:hypothetical protein [Pseudomonadota bacterium]